MFANVCFCWWMRILASQYITITAMKKKSGQTIHSCSMRVPYAGLWAVIYSVITRVLIVRAHRWDLNSTRWYRFKLNSRKLCQFKHKSQSLRAQWEDLYVRSLDARIKLSLKYCVWMDKFTQKWCQNARLGKYPIADIAGWTYSISAFS